MFLISTFLNFKALKFEGADARISMELFFFIFPGNHYRSIGSILAEPENILLSIKAYVLG